MLRSNYVNAHEDAILDLLVTWADLTGTTFDDTKELLRLVRLPFVPVDSHVMNDVVSKNLVGEDMLRICRLFQTDGELNKSRVRAGKKDKNTISRLSMFKRKQSTPERLVGRELMRNY